MDLAADLKARGLVERTSADLEDIFKETRTIYIGVDPTADSMHVGHLVWILLMKRLGAAGHKLIFIMGGGTGMIGDPKEKGERILLDDKTIKKNLSAIRRQLEGILGKVSFRIVDNAEWLLKERLIDFLRDIGKHFTVNDLIKRENIKRRLTTPDESISYTEFTYALLQGFDFLTLNQKYGCDMQVGGNDQWTNLLSGVDLIRKIEGKEAFAYTFPLVTDSSGKKFGKSEGNAVWLDPKKTSPYTFYQFWLNQPDSVVEKYLKFYTFLSLMEISMLMELHKRNPGKREAQQALAREITGIVHGTDAAARCATVSEVLFGDRSLGSLSEDERSILIAEAPAFETKDGTLIVDALVESDLAESKAAAKRLITAKGISLNGQSVVNIEATLRSNDFDNGLALLRRGKQALVLVHT
jgi:tyrosyl-tRNA synthetase